MVERGQQRVERARVADLPQRHRRALGDPRIAIGEGVEELVERARFADHAQDANGLDTERRVIALGDLEQRPQRRLTDHAERPGGAQAHVVFAVCQQPHQRIHRRGAQHPQRERRLGARELVLAL